MQISHEEQKWDDGEDGQKQIPKGTRAEPEDCISELPAVSFSE